MINKSINQSINPQINKCCALGTPNTQYSRSTQSYWIQNNIYFKKHVRLLNSKCYFTLFKTRCSITVMDGHSHFAMWEEAGNWTHPHSHSDEDAYNPKWAMPFWHMMKKFLQTPLPVPGHKNTMTNEWMFSIRSWLQKFASWDILYNLKHSKCD